LIYLKLWAVFVTGSWSDTGIAKSEVRNICSTTHFGLYFVR